MGRRVVAIERFQDAAPPAPSPVSVNVFPSTDAIKQMTGTVNVDALARDMTVQDAVVEGGKAHNNVRPHIPHGPKPEPRPSPNPSPEPPFGPSPGPIIIIPNLGPGGEYNPNVGPAPNPNPTPAPNPNPGPYPPAPNPNPYPPRPAPNPNPYQPNPPPGPAPPGPNSNNSCGWCPACPDMSQYIRMDEIPCWNCTLP